jgi:hypothetical protein
MMTRKNLLLAVVAAALLAVLVLACFASATKLEMEEEAVTPPTEAELKKMKVKELKGFLADRGVECASCTEKNDYVKEALKHLATPLLPSKRKLKPKGEFWEFWGLLARSICEEGAKKKGVKDAAAICEPVVAAVDSYFMQHGKRTAGKLKKKPAALLKTSVAEPYQGAGRRLLSRLVSHCIKTPAACSSLNKVNDLMDKDAIKGVDFNKWITNVGIENTNPMYEALKDKKLNSDL